MNLIILLAGISSITLACFPSAGQYPTTTTATGTTAFSQLDSLLVNYEDNMYVTDLTVCYRYNNF